MNRYGIDSTRPLSQKLDSRDLAALKPIPATGHMPLDRIDHMRPWAAVLVLSIQPMLARGSKVESGADITVTRQATAEVKQVRVFETL